MKIKNSAFVEKGIAMVGEHDPDMVPPFTHLELSETPKIRMVTEARHTFGNRAAAQLWRLLKLPEVPAMFADDGQGRLEF